jgi:hypothetical protein
MEAKRYLRIVFHLEPFHRGTCAADVQIMAGHGHCGMSELISHLGQRGGRGNRAVDGDEVGLISTKARRDVGWFVPSASHWREAPARLTVLVYYRRLNFILGVKDHGQPGTSGDTQAGC